MILTDSDSIDADNNFAKAYNALTKDAKWRMRQAIMVACGVSEKTVREWINNPDLVSSPSDRLHIALVLFAKKEIKEIFNT